MRDGINKGFTLIELMVALIVLSIIVSVGLPNFSNLINDNRLVTEVNTFVASLQLARSEAIRRGVGVSIRKNSTNDSVWEEGWEVFTDVNGDGIQDDDDDTLQVKSGLASGLTLRTGAGFTTYLTYLPTGIVLGPGANTDTFILCGKDGDVNRAREILINPTGRPFTSKGTTSCP